MNEYNFKMIENKWQRIWNEQQCFNSDPIENKKKYFITIPFPYLNGNLHVGHIRTFTIGDTIARFKRMNGYNVLFPMGFHVTGTPIVGLSEQIKKKDKLTLEVYEKYHNIPKNTLASLDTPEKIVDYFKIEAEKDMKSIGYSIDWRRKFTTTDSKFKKFVEWQYKKLYKLNYIVKGDHPVKWCPNDNNPVEDHDILKGENATIIEYYMLKFKYKNIIFPCATLRPETIFGVTNIWINSKINYYKILVSYQEKNNYEETWIVSSIFYKKLLYMNYNIKIIEKNIDIYYYIGKYIENPITKHKLIILPSSFIDISIGTGIVMSVPCHAPYDYLELLNLSEKLKIDSSIYPQINRDFIYSIKPIKVIKIDTKKDEKLNLKEIIENLKNKYNSYDNIDDNIIKELTKTIYKKEYNSGRLLEISEKYNNSFIKDIKDKMIDDFINLNILIKFYELSEPVTCRCGSNCLVNMVKDQWFLNYSNKEWKRKAKECLSNIKLIPEEIRTEFENKIDWIKDKACARKKGLGTIFPFDKNWIIESLGDSTIYMAYYIISKYINKYNISDNKLTEDFFDYIFLDNKSIEKLESIYNKYNIIDIKKEFQYWYPVDLRSSGKDLISNHLLFYIFHHVALFDKKYYPLSIGINGYVSLEGKKMSKSKGPLLTLKKSIELYGADVTRFYILSTAEQIQDLDWKQEGIEASRKQIEKWYNYILLNYNNKNINVNNNNDYMLQWLESRFQRYILETINSLNNLKTRNAIQNIYYLFNNDLKWYIKRNGNESIINNIFDRWIKLLYPFIPHICEELWEKTNHSNYLYNENYPTYEESKINNELEISEQMILQITKDIEEIKNIIQLKDIKNIYIVLSEKWKYDILKMIINNINNDINENQLLKIIITSNEFKKDSKNIKKYVFKILNNLKCYNNIINKINYLNCILNDKLKITSELNYFIEEYKCNIDIINETNRNEFEEIKEQIDLKRNNADPGKPGIYIV